MKRVVTGWDRIFGPWLMEKTGGSWVPGRGSTIGLLDDNEIVGASYYTDCNGASVILHCAGEGKKWLNREFLWFSFHYPFEQLQVNKIISPVESTNFECKRFIESLGFTLEATLKDASPKGNLLLYTLERADCKWLSLRNTYRGQAQGSSST